MIAVTWYWHRLVSLLRVIIFTASGRRGHYQAQAHWRGYTHTSSEYEEDSSVFPFNHRTCYSLQPDFVILSFFPVNIALFFINVPHSEFEVYCPVVCEESLTWPRLANCQSCRQVNYENILTPPLSSVSLSLISSGVTNICRATMPPHGSHYPSSGNIMCIVCPEIINQLFALHLGKVRKREQNEILFPMIYIPNMWTYYDDFAPSLLAPSHSTGSLSR